MRRVLWRVLALGVAVTLAATAALLVYAQTDDGFRRVVLPLVALLLGGDLAVERGRLDLDGSLEIEGGSYRDDTAGIDVSVTRLTTRVAPLSFLPGEQVRILSLDADGLRLKIATSLAASEPAAGKKREPAEVEGIGFAIPLCVDEARLRGAGIILERGAKTTMEIGPFDLDVRDLGPGSTGRLTLDGAAKLAPGTAEAESWDARATVELTADAAGAPTQAKLDATIGLRPSKSRTSEPVGLRLALDASAAERRSIDFALRADATRAGLQTGNLTATGNWPLDADPLDKPPPLTASLAIKDLSHLNWILTMLGWNLFESGQVNAEIEIAPPAGNASAVKVRLQGDGLAAQLASRGGSTPPLTLSLLQQGSWSPARKQLRIDAASLRVAAKGGGTVDSVLDGKLLLDFDAPGGAAAAHEEPAVWRAELSRVDLVHLDSWLATFGSHALDGLRGGLGGTLRVDVAELGGRIAATGRLAIEGLRTSESEAGPIDVTSKLDVTVRDLERISISAIELGLAAPEPLFTAKVSGDYDLQHGAGRLEIALDSEDLATALAGLAILPSAAGDRVHGGKTTGVFRANLGPTTEITGTAAIENIELALGNGVRRRQDLRVEAELKSGDGVIDFQKLVLSVADPQARKAGAITVSGTLPGSAKAATRETELEIALRGLALGHWIEALGGPSLESIGSVSLEGDLALRRAAGEPRLTVEGEERLSLAGGAAEEKIEVTTRNTVEIVPGATTKFAAVLSTRESNRNTGLAKIEGEMGPEDGSLRLDAEIDRLRFREIEASSGSLKIERAGGHTLIEIAPTSFAAGHIEGRLEHRAAEAQSLAWSLRTRKVDAGRLYRSLVGDGRRVEGLVDLDTTGAGEGRDAEQLRRNVSGGIEAEMSKARLANTPVLTYLAKVTGISEFDDLTFDRIVADIAIGEGLARIRHMEASGHTANLEITGQATLTGNLDLHVNPRVGPSLTDNLGKIFAVGMLVRTASDFVALPIDVTVKGRYDDPRYAVEPRVPGALDRLTGGLAGGAAGAVVDTGKTVGEGVIKGVGGILKEGGALFGGGRRKGPK